MAWGKLSGRRSEIGAGAGGDYFFVKFENKFAKFRKKVVKMADYFSLHPWADCVPAPYYDGAEVFENALDLIEDGCTTLLNRLENRK